MKFIRDLAPTLPCLAALYERLVTDALSVIAGEKNPAEIDVNVWGPRAYYFAESCEMSFRQFMAKYMVPALKRVGGELEWIRSLSEEEKNVQQVTVDEDVDIVLYRLGGGASRRGFGVAILLMGWRLR